MKTRILTALAMVVVVLPCVLLGRLPYTILLAFVAVAATFEMLSICQRPKANIYLYIVVGIYIIYSVFFNTGLMISIEPFMILVIALLCAHLFDKGMDYNRVCYYALTAFIVAGGLRVIYLLRMELGFSYIIMLALATFGTDTGAYFSGLLFGKHKLCPRLSPKKTIEGSIGGIIVGTLLSTLFAYYIGIPIELGQVVFICFILTITGQVGDLTFSAMKRQFEVKDFSQLLPGHGGILDRIDALLFNAMVLGLMMQIVVKVVG